MSFRTNPEIKLLHDGEVVRAEIEYTRDILDSMAQEVARRMGRDIDDAVLARLGYVRIRRAKRLTTGDASTDCATGHSECSACGGSIDFWDKWCRHCGAMLYDAKGDE